MQAKLWQRGFTNTSSGKLNERIQKKQHKILDLNDFDVQMLSPQFLQAKTLKKPISQMGIHLQKTNPNGIAAIHEQIETQSKNVNQASTNINNKNERRIIGSTQEQPCYKMIEGKNMNIRPAYQNNNWVESNSSNINNNNANKDMQVTFKDKNSVISALFKKGQLKYNQTIQIKVIKPAHNQTKKIVGPAEKKLKQLFGRSNTKSDKMSAMIASQGNKDDKRSIEDQIGQQINQSIQEYGNESFDKISASAIKQSIVGGSSGLIKQQIPQALSYRSSLAKSAGDIKQQIKQSINESLKSSARQSIKYSGQQFQQIEQIQEDVYEQIFEEVSLSDELSKSKANKLKRPKENQDKFQLSVSASASKGFRTKTNNVLKSIRLADQISVNSNKKNMSEKLQQKINNGDKMATQLLKEKQRLTALQDKISDIMRTKNIGDRNMELRNEKNMDILYKFRIQVNRLITSQNFSSKLRKLTGFLGQSQTKSSQMLDNLQDKILKNLVDNLESFRKSQVSRSDVEAMKSHYDKQLQILLRDQQIRLRVQMDKKLHDKDVELKAMIAELQKKFSQGVSRVQGTHQKGLQKYTGNDKLQIQSDYSIQSDEISWKADLWQLLPDYQKKRLYERQGTQVANFLTSVLFKEVKEESLSRSGDLSFEFPEDLNVSGSFESSLPSLKKGRKIEDSNDSSMFKSAINREQLIKDIDSKQKQYPSLVDIKKKARPEPVQVNITENKISESNLSVESEKRDTVAASEVIRILSKYKPLYLKKKNDTIRKVIKTLQLKIKDNEPLSSYLAELKILYDKQISPQDLTFVRAYEEQLVMELTGFYNKCGNRKYAYIEEQMRKIYDRFVVTCQIKAAQSSTKLATQIAPHQNYIDLRMKQEQKKLKDNIVEQIINILSAEFAKQMPKKKK